MHTKGKYKNLFQILSKGKNKDKPLSLGCQHLEFMIDVVIKTMLVNNEKSYLCRANRTDLYQR